MASNGQNGTTGPGASTWSASSGPLTNLPQGTEIIMSFPTPTDLIRDPIINPFIDPLSGPPGSITPPESSTFGSPKTPIPPSTQGPRTEPGISPATPPASSPLATTSRNGVPSHTSTPPIPQPPPIAVSTTSNPSLVPSSSRTVLAPSSSNSRTSSQSPPSATPSPTSITTSAKSSIVLPTSSPMSEMATNSSLPASTSSPGAVSAPPMPSPSSPKGSSTNIVLIAVPIVVGAVLVALLVVFLCWWKRRKSFRGPYHNRNRSNDTEMSQVGSDASRITHEPKAVSEHLNARASRSPNIPTMIVERSEPRTWPAESRKFEPEILPGLASMSPIGSSFGSPPPYRKNERGSASPSALFADLHQTVSPKTAGHSTRPATAQRHSTAKRQTMTRSMSADWPLPSPARNENLRDNISSERHWATAAENGEASPKALPSWPSTPRTSNHERREGIAGPSNPIPLVPSSAPQHKNANGSPRHVSSQSPFDHPNDTSSEYSTSSQDMLPVLGRRQINDDGVSEMSVSTRDDKQKLRLHNREPDEISVVSSLHDDDNGKGELDNNDSAEERVDSPMRGAQR